MLSDNWKNFLKRLLASAVALVLLCGCLPFAWALNGPAPEKSGAPVLRWPSGGAQPRAGAAYVFTTNDILVQGKGAGAVRYQVQAACDAKPAAAAKIQAKGGAWEFGLRLKPGKNALTVDSDGTRQTIQITYDTGTIPAPSAEALARALARQPEKVPGKAQPPLYQDDTLLVFFTRETSPEQARRRIAEAGGKAVGENYFLNMYVANFPNAGAPQLKALAEQLKKLPEVRSASLDSFVPVDSIAPPNDPWDWDVSDASWLDDSVGNSNWGLKAIEVFPAWDFMSNTQTEPVSVGVVDSGINLNHQEFNDPGNNVHVSLVGSHNIEQDHGNHTSGTIAAASNNSFGITGIVPKGSLYFAAAGAGGPYLDDALLLAGVTNVIQSGAKALNCSWGGGTDAYDYVLAMQELLNDQYEFLIVQSAGNNYGQDASENGPFNSISTERFGAAVQPLVNRILTVASVENYRDAQNGYQLSNFSNIGPRVDLAAPGSEIYSCTHDGLEYMDGTSMAAPHVSGVASLLWSVKPTLTGAQVKKIMTLQENTTEAYGWDNYGGMDHYRMLNANKAVQFAAGYEPPPPVPATNVYIQEQGPLSLSVGDAIQLHAQVLPEEAEGYALVWGAENDNVTVDDGFVEAVGTGQTTVYVNLTSDGGDLIDQATVQVTIDDGGGNEDPQDGYNFDLPLTLNLKYKEATNAFKNAYRRADGNIHFKSDNAKKLSIDYSGNLTFHKKGDTTITVYENTENKRIAHVFIHVKYTFTQMLMVVLLFGWIWM